MNDHASARSTASRNALESETPLPLAKRLTCSGDKSSSETTLNADALAATCFSLLRRASWSPTCPWLALTEVAEYGNSFSHRTRSVTGRHAGARPVMKRWVRCLAAASRTLIFRTARSKSDGSFRRDSSTESRRSQPSSVEASQSSNSLRVPSSNAISKSVATFSRRRKKAALPSPRKRLATALISAVFPEPASDKTMTRCSFSRSSQVSLLPLECSGSSSEPGPCP